MHERIMDLQMKRKQERKKEKKEDVKVQEEKLRETH